MHFLKLKMDLLQLKLDTFEHGKVYQILFTLLVGYNNR